MLKRKVTFYLSFILISLSLFSFTSETALNLTKPKSEKKETRFECKYSQCQATAKSTGKQCKHCVSNKDDLYCWQHTK
jgi:hypothetical protein